MGALNVGKQGTSMVPAGRRPREKKSERNDDECPVCKAGKRSPCQDYVELGNGKARVVIRMVTHRTEASGLGSKQQKP